MYDNADFMSEGGKGKRKWCNYQIISKFKKEVSLQNGENLNISALSIIFY